jgi:SHS family lactate transporter-like MFS transporter
MLLILRALFGFAMGGEWGVGASLALESIPTKARGVISGLLQEGYAAGYLLAALVFGLLFDRVGWRGLFIVGVAPAALSALIFVGVRESPAFEERRAAGTHATHPHLWWLGLGALIVALTPAVGSAIAHISVTPLIYGVCVPVGLAGLWAFRRHWRMALYLAVMMTAFNLFSHGTQDLYPTFLRGLKFGTHDVSAMTVIGNLGAIVGGVLIGAWSERLGRRRAVVIAALASLLVIPLWAFSHTMAMLAGGAFLMQMAVQGAWGVIPAHLNELAPPDARGAFPGFVYQLGNLLASGLIVGQAQLAKSRGGDYGFALAVTAGAVAVAIALVVGFGPERRGTRLTVEAA